MVGTRRVAAKEVPDSVTEDDDDIVCLDDLPKSSRKKRLARKRKIKDCNKRDEETKQEDADEFGGIDIEGVSEEEKRQIKEALQASSKDQNMLVHMETKPNSNISSKSSEGGVTMQSYPTSETEADKSDSEENRTIQEEQMEDNDETQPPSDSEGSVGLNFNEPTLDESRDDIFDQESVTTEDADSTVKDEEDIYMVELKDVASDRQKKKEESFGDGEIKRNVMKTSSPAHTEKEIIEEEDQMSFDCPSDSASQQGETDDSKGFLPDMQTDVESEAEVSDVKQLVTMETNPSEENSDNLSQNSQSQLLISECIRPEQSESQRNLNNAGQTRSSGSQKSFDVENKRPDSAGSHRSMDDDVKPQSSESQKSVDGESKLQGSSRSQQSEVDSIQPSTSSNNIEDKKGDFKHVPLRRHYRGVLPQYRGIRHSQHFGDGSIESLETILQKFEMFRVRLREEQRKLKEKLLWPEPVKVGQHQSRTIDSKRRGRDSVYSDLVDSDDEKNQNITDVVRPRSRLRNSGSSDKDLPDLIVEGGDDVSETYSRRRLTRRGLHSKSVEQNIMSADTQPYNINDDDDDDDDFVTNLKSRTVRKAKDNRSSVNLTETSNAGVNTGQAETQTRMQTRNRSNRNLNIDKSEPKVLAAETQEEMELQEAIRRSKVDSQMSLPETQIKDDDFDWLTIKQDDGKQVFENEMHVAKLKGYSIPKHSPGHSKSHKKVEKSEDIEEDEVENVKEKLEEKTKLHKTEVSSGNKYREKLGNEAGIKSREKLSNENEADNKPREKLSNENEAGSKSKEKLSNDNEAGSKSKEKLSNDNEAGSKSKEKLSNDNEAASRGRKRKSKKQEVVTLVEDTQDQDTEVSKSDKQSIKRHCFKIVTSSESEGESVAESQNIDGETETETDVQCNESNNSSKSKSESFLSKMVNKVKNVITPTKDKVSDIEAKSPIITRKRQKVASGKICEKSTPCSKSTSLGDKLHNLNTTSKRRLQNVENDEIDLTDEGDNIEKALNDTDHNEEKVISDGVRRFVSRPLSKESNASDNLSTTSSQMSTNILDESGDIYSTQYCEIKARKGKEGSIRKEQRNVRTVKEEKNIKDIYAIDSDEDDVEVTKPKWMPGVNKKPTIVKGVRIVNNNTRMQARNENISQYFQGNVAGGVTAPIDLDPDTQDAAEDRLNENVSRKSEIDEYQGADRAPVAGTSGMSAEPAVEETKMETVECPLCSHEFPINIIEQHASACVGPPDQQPDNEPQGTYNHQMRGPRQDGNHTTGFNASQRQQHGNVRDEAPVQGGETDVCYICDQVVPKGALFNAHMDRCVELATQQQKELEKFGYNRAFTEPEPEEVQVRQLRGRHINPTDRATTPKATTRRRPQQSPASSHMTTTPEGRPISPASNNVKNEHVRRVVLQNDDQENDYSGEEPIVKRIRRGNKQLLNIDGYNSDQVVKSADDEKESGSGSSWDESSSTDSSDDDNISLASVVRSGSSALVTGPWNNRSKSINQSDKSDNVPDWVRAGVHSPIKSFVPISQQDDSEYFQKQFSYKKDRVEKRMTKRKRSKKGGNKRRRKRRKVRKVKNSN